MKKMPSLRHHCDRQNLRLSPVHHQFQGHRIVLAAMNEQRVIVKMRINVWDLKTRHSNSNQDHFFDVA